MDATLDPRETGATMPSMDGIDHSDLDAIISEASGWLGKRQKGDGHWVFELEADATIPAEYILLNHFLDEIDDARIAIYLRRIQADHGGWPLFHDGNFDMSASVKAQTAAFPPFLAPPDGLANPNPEPII